MSTLTTNNCVDIDYETIRLAMNNEPYWMSMAGNDSKYVEAAVNQGIDPYLEACFVPDRGDKYQWVRGKLDCVVSVESLPVLLRRLFEMDDEDNEGGPGMLASDIILTLGLDEHGKYVGREALGLD